MLRSQRPGLKLIELMIVLAVVAIVIGLLIPATRNVRGAAARMSCTINLKQISFALHNYENTHGHFPAGCLGNEGAPADERLSWMLEIYPYIESSNLYRRFDVTRSFQANHEHAGLPIKTYRCPSQSEREKDPITSYHALSGITPDSATLPIKSPGIGFMGYDRKTKLSDITDGIANTLGVMETNHQIGPWAQGGDSTLRSVDVNDTPLIGTNRPFGGLHSSIANVMLLDGALRAMRTTIDPHHFAALVTISGGEPAYDWDK